LIKFKVSKKPPDHHYNSSFLHILNQYINLNI